LSYLSRMRSAILLCVVPLCFADHLLSRSIHQGCRPDCKIGQGECLCDNDCSDGLICDIDNWFEQNKCVAGPNTKNYEISDWGEWSDCSASQCGQKGIRRRTRTCTAPEDGGLECPTDLKYYQVEGCMQVCSKALCNPQTWLQFSWDCCTPGSPCFEGEGDCDTDDDCSGDLVCGNNNCPQGFPARFGKSAPDCCEPTADMSRHLLNYQNCESGKCRQGEGDCDSDDDCLHGLVCDADNWMGKDVCIAGPHTVDGFLTSWSSWSDCSAVACGTQGTQKREKFCLPPEFGGNDCPENALVEQLQKCWAPECEPSLPNGSKASCNPATWEKFSWNCCTEEEPCYEGEGDCDTDWECADDLLCIKNSCPDTFTARVGHSKPDCCGKP